MNLVLLRYLLILASAISSMYLTASIESYTVYTLLVLLFFWVAQLREKWLPARFRFFLVLVEIAFAGWLTYHYNGILFVVFFSTLLSLFLQQIPHRAGFIMALLFVMNVSVSNQSAAVWIVANCILVTIAALLLHIQSTAGRKEEIEALYDQLRRKHYDLEEARKRMLEYAKKVENVAQVEERTRISREIHDDLGHKLIRLKMMMEAVIRILPTQPDKGVELIHQVRDQLTESMETLRATVRKMKPGDAAIRSYSLHRLIEDFADSSGIQVNFRLAGAPYALYPSEEVVLYRNAQEAMTNAIRHGKATMVDIELRYESAQIVLQVSNNGSIPEGILSKGFGLSGMEERIELLGGKLQVELRDPFTVTTILPHHRTEGVG